MEQGKIVKISGPLVVASGMSDADMYDVVKVGNQGLTGEIIEMRGGNASIQVYEETAGLQPGELVYSTGAPLSVELGPGLIETIYDGIQRPLSVLLEKTGTNIARGVSEPALDRDKKWDFVAVAKVGDEVSAGEVLGTVEETIAVTQRIMVPYKVSGKVKSIESGSFTVDETVAVIEDAYGKDIEVKMMQRWPVRVERPYKEKLSPEEPLITGQRVIDTMFPIAKGGVAAVPGPFGSGKTVVQHQLAKWADADIVVYIGCGERGNEMTDVLNEFPELVDPKTGESLMRRTVLIANTSDMPVAAREASVYTGITIAEYFRDMGYSVALMADSTSRWAEALREISGRLEEMPAEEGFPAYLASRLSAFYERAGMMQTLNGSEGSVSIIGAVSPQGGDFSEPVTQNTKRFVRCFWGLDKRLAYARHFPAIQWLDSYSEYLNDLAPWYSEHVNKNFVEYRNRLVYILNQEAALMEIVKLIGADVLPDDQKLVLDIAKVIRVGFLQQNAFHKDDTCVPLMKQYKMMDVILYLYQKSKALVHQGMPMSVLHQDSIWDRVSSIKYDVPNDKLEMLDDYIKDIDRFYETVLEKNA